MKSVHAVWRRAAARLRSSAASQSGAFDLPSILVGVVIVGILAAGVLAAIFGVIPFTQDHGAKQDLDAIVRSEGVAKAKDGRFMDSPGLDDARYLKARPSIGVAADANGSCFVAASKSGSGQIFVSTDKNPAPVNFTSTTVAGCVTLPTLDDLVDGLGGSIPSTPPAASASVMKSTWDTSLSVWGDSCTTLTIPLKGEVDATIDWGDGSTQEVTGSMPVHTYADTPGLHEITIDGTFTEWVGEDWDTGSVGCLTKVTEWGETGTVSMYAGFSGAENLTEVAEIPSTVRDLSWTFESATAFNGNVNNWDVSNVTTMDSLFDSATSFNQPLAWDVSNVTSMDSMFSSATSFNHPLAWDVSNVTSMYGMFSSATSFNQPLAWDVSNVTMMGRMFANNTAFNQPLVWNVSHVAFIDGMFDGATSFNQPLNSWDVSAVARASAMFRGATSFNQPLNSWDTANNTEFRHMFNGAASFNQDLSGWNVDKLESDYLSYGYLNFSAGSALSSGHIPLVLR